MTSPRQDATFASDNAAGVHPAVLAALSEANVGAARAYGDDPWTDRAQELIREAVGVPDAAVWLLWGGTGANVLGLRALTNRIDSVLCGTTSHLVGAETGAPELTAGVSLIGVPTVHGRLTPEAVQAAMPGRLGDHRPRPRVLSITQATEAGTVYTVDQVRALADLAHGMGLYLHMDGARLMNAAASLEVPIAAFTGQAGVDVLSFGGTKNGLLGAEAVVFLRPELAPDAGRHRKQITQLASKMRFLSAQFVAMLQADAGVGWARHAHAQARRIAQGLEGVPGVVVQGAVQTNAVFAQLPPAWIGALQQRWAFELWDPRQGVVRWMTAWDTTEAQVDALVAAVRDLSRNA